MHDKGDKQNLVNAWMLPGGVPSAVRRPCCCTAADELLVLVYGPASTAAKPASAAVPATFGQQTCPAAAAWS